MNVLGAAASLAGNYQAGAAILAGLIGGLAFLAVVSMGLGTGMTRMNFLPMLGSMMAPKASRSAIYGIGLVIHLMASAAFGLIHAVHGIGVLILMPMMLTMAHPLVRSGDLERPGAFLIGFGSMTPAGSLAAHVVFGLVVGSIYTGIVL
jgi:hypothetical protein